MINPHYQSVYTYALCFNHRRMHYLSILSDKTLHMHVQFISIISTCIIIPFYLTKNNVYTYTVYFSHQCMHYHSILSDKNTVYVYTVHWLWCPPPCHSTGTMILSSKTDGELMVKIHQVNQRRTKPSSSHHWTFLCPLFRQSVLTSMIHQPMW